MVVEFLTIEVPRALLEEWLDADERIWTRFLERQDGFVDKQVWVSRAPVDEHTVAVHAVIRWASEEQWKAIADDVLRRVDDEMAAAVGFRPGEQLTVYDVARTSMPGRST